MKQKKIAFWTRKNHDGPLLLLAGCVEETDDTGKVRVEGRDDFFEPAFVLPMETGNRLWQELIDLESQYNSEVYQLKNRCLAQIAKAITRARWG